VPSAYNTPVAPYVTSDGNIASLSDVVTSPVAAVGTPAAPYDYGIVNLASTTVSASVVASLGYSDLVNFSVSGTAYYWLLDVVATLPALPDQSASPLISQVYGVGIRVVLKAWNVNTKLSMSAYGLAAQAELGMAQTTFQVETLGPGLDSLASLRPLMVAIGATFDVEMMQTLGQCIGDLTDYLADNEQTMTPQLLGVNFDWTNASLLDPAGGYVYALRRITKGNNYTQALQNVPSTLPPGVEISTPIVQAVYTQIVGPDPTAAPTSQQKSTANTLLNVGS